MPVTAGWTLNPWSLKLPYHRSARDRASSTWGRCFSPWCCSISGRTGFKDFRCHGVEQEFRHCVAELPAYNRFVALTPQLLPPFDLLLHGDRGQATSIYCVDSARLAVCHNARTSGNRVL